MNYKIFIGEGKPVVVEEDSESVSSSVSPSTSPSVTIEVKELSLLQKIGQLCLQILWISIKMIVGFILAVGIILSIIILFDL